jgi:hypothetical protein
VAGQAGYYAVALDNGDAGIARVAANQKPASVGGHSVTRSQYLGTTTQSILSNWSKAVNDIGAYGLHELGPPGANTSIIGGGTDLGTLIKMAQSKGSAILTKTPSSAEWDPTPTVFVAGLGSVVSGAVAAAGVAAAGETAAEAAAGGGAAEAGAAGTAGGLAGAAARGAAGAAAKAAAGVGLADLLGAKDTEKLIIRALEALVGIALLLLGLSALTGVSNGSPVDAVKTVGRYIPK